jgi:hypothetical protein
LIYHQLGFNVADLYLVMIRFSGQKFENAVVG